MKTKQKVYYTVVFIQSHELTENFDDGRSDFFDAHPKDQLSYLSQWLDCFEKHSPRDSEPWGTSDTVTYHSKHGQKLAMSLNRRLGYAALTLIEGAKK